VAEDASVSGWHSWSVFGGDVGWTHSQWASAAYADRRWQISVLVFISAGVAEDKGRCRRETKVKSSGKWLRWFDCDGWEVCSG
jgi:hypothetical protein